VRVPDVLQGGAEGRPPGRGGRVAGALVVAVLAGAAVWQVVTGPDPRPAPPSMAGHESPSASVAAPLSPSPTLTAQVVQVAPATSRPHRTLPWSRLPSGAPLSVDLASGRVVVVDGQARDLGTPARVVSMDSSRGGPVLLVQATGAVSLEQLRPDGARLVLDDFAGDRRLPRGVAVDPTGRFVAYAVTAVVPGNNGIVVRDLRTGAATVRLRTREPFAVSDWTTAGVVLEVAADPGGPPYLWTPGPSRPRHVVPFAHGSGGPVLLASSPSSPRWLMTRPELGCTDLVIGVSRRPARSFCSVALSGPVAWSPHGDLVAGVGEDGSLLVLDVADGTTRSLRTPRRAVPNQVAWSGPRTVLAVVTDRSAARGAVLRCRIGGSCERAALPAELAGRDVVLAR
jgi:WD40 repeat protein